MLLGVSRGKEFSPNRQDSDTAIINAVADNLRQMGHEVVMCSENEYLHGDFSGAELVFNMARHQDTVAKLQKAEDCGTKVVNSGYGIANCIRRPLTEKVIASGLPSPKSAVIVLEGSEIDADSLRDASYPCWIKRGDGCAQIKEDVSFVTNTEEAVGVLRSFKERGVASAVLNEHLAGDLVKFYGVEGTDFFYWYYPSPTKNSKFGLEAINGESHGFAFSVERMKQISDDMAKLLNVPIYGGDAVVSSEGDIKIIDFNDWPSFSACRDDAAKAIAARIHQML